MEFCSVRLAGMQLGGEGSAAQRDEGDLLSNANTLINMGKVRDGNRIGRGLYIAKHRGSACDERMVTYGIGDAGVSFLAGIKLAPGTAIDVHHH